MKGDKRKKKSWISVRLLTTPILLALPEATNIYYSEYSQNLCGSGPNHISKLHTQI